MYSYILMIGSVVVALDARTTFLIYSIACEQYPVIAVDSAVPVTRPGGTPSGRLQVLLAMGTERQLLALKQLHSQQVNALQRAFVAELTAHLPTVPVFESCCTYCISRCFNISLGVVRSLP